MPILQTGSEAQFLQAAGRLLLIFGIGFSHIVAYRWGRNHGFSKGGEAVYKTIVSYDDDDDSGDGW